MQQELQGADYIASTVGKQKEMNVSSPLALSLSRIPAQREDRSLYVSHPNQDNPS